MKIELNDCSGASTLYPEEVADKILGGTLPPDETMGEAVIEDGELVVDILYNEPMDLRIHGFRKRQECLDLERIREEFTNAEYCTWVKDEDGNNVLLCFEI